MTYWMVTYSLNRRGYLQFCRSFGRTSQKLCFYHHLCQTFQSTFQSIIMSAYYRSSTLILKIHRTLVTDHDFYRMNHTQ
jgi:hypothetical protein